MTTIHESFETIQRGKQNYRITTEVEYFPEKNSYKCKAFLHKSYGGKARNQINSFSTFVSEEDKIETEINTCAKMCKRQIDKIEEAKNIDINVNTGDT